MRRRAFFFGAMLIGALVNAQPVPNPVGSGIGQISIGMNRPTLETILGQKLEIQFAGDRRGGLTISEPSALATLRAEKLYGSKVEAIDLFFVEDKGELSLEMFSIAVPCDAVSELRVRLSQQAKAGAVGAYAWGAEAKPACRVWMRHA